LENIFSDFECYLSENAPKIESFHPFFEKAAYEMVLNGGKRFRPKLFFAVLDSFAPLLVRSAFPIALAIEVLHTYSLVHDDLPCMDNAALRRGHPTLHTKYDEVSALLAGDGLNTYAFYLIARAPLSSDTRIRLVEELSLSGGFSGMVVGQALDCHFEKKILDIKSLEFLHIHKTGKLIASSMKMGAICACVGRELEESLFEFGIKAGLLFQINDDILDATQTSNEAGKSTQNDEDKNSFVNLLGLEGARVESQKLKDELNSDIKEFPQALQDRLMPLLKNYL